MFNQSSDAGDDTAETFGWIFEGCNDPEALADDCVIPDDLSTL